MEKYNAVYARQSVEKKDSLSIDGQIDLCRKAADEELHIYKDAGYSGKNTQRPDFQRLIADIQADKIGKLYVYRLRTAVGNLEGARCRIRFCQRKL